MNKANQVCWQFIVEFGKGISIVWPVLSGLIFFMMILGFISARLEGWPFGDGLYFALTTGFCIGYGDFIPHHLLVRGFAVCLAFLGITMTAVAAVAVKALEAVTTRQR